MDTDLTKQEKRSMIWFSLGFLFCYAYFWWPVFILEGFGQLPWLIPFATFVVVPLLDALIGEYRNNLSETANRWARTQLWFRLLPLLAVPSFFAYQAVIFKLFIHSDSLQAKIGWVLTAGIAGGVMAINVAHELIHRKTRIERRSGGLLLAGVAYGSFKVEHIYGHHTDVATPEDVTTAPKSMGVYQFWLRALLNTPKKAWRIGERLKMQKSLRLNELVWLYGTSLLMLLGYTFFGGASGLVYWIAQALVAILLLETVNYIEHYGLLRHVAKTGRYEPVSHHHSWNSSRLLTNYLLFNLQRHSDHHASAVRTYPTLRHFDDSPQLPQGYAAMILLALLPRFWFRVMDKRLVR